MHTLKTIGVMGTVTALLLSASVALAENQSPNTAGENRSASVAVAPTAAQDRMQAARDKVASHLADIKDQAKQQLAQQLVVQFENFNTTWTTHLVNVLDSYNAILQKIQARAGIAAGRGKDISATTAAIQSAKTAIAAARTAVVAQAAKTYALDTSTLPTTAASTPSGQEKLMKGLRESFQTLHKGLFKDLFALRDGPMKAARKAVQAALQTLSGIPGVDEDNAASAKKPND